MPFVDKVILITGSSSGIGAACAEYFAKEGGLLALVGRNAVKFERVIEKIKDSGVEAEPLVILADVSVDAERIMSETIETYGRLDILINCAGFGNGGNLETLKMEEFDAMMATNVRGLVELTKYAIPHLIESKGNIVNISTALSLISSPDFIAYATIKAAVDQFTKCLAMELASKGVRVNCVNPAAIDTDFHGLTGEPYEAFRQFIARVNPIHRIGTTDDCVNAIAFLADENAKFVTGSIVPVDGGLSAKGALCLSE